MTVKKIQKIGSVLKLKNAYQFLPLFRNHKYDRKDYVKWMTAGIPIRGIVNSELMKRLIIANHTSMYL